MGLYNSEGVGTGNSLLMIIIPLRRRGREPLRREKLFMPARASKRKPPRRWTATPAWSIFVVRPRGDKTEHTLVFPLVRRRGSGPPPYRFLLDHPFLASDFWPVRNELYAFDPTPDVRALRRARDLSYSSGVRTS